jgi:hypothetical protein
MILPPQNISITPNGPKCKHDSFCCIFHKLSEYCNLEIALCGKQGLLVIKKNYHLLVTASHIFVQNLQFLPQNDQQNTHTLFGISEMITCDIYDKTINKDLTYW